MTLQEAAGIAQAEVREAFFRMAGQIHDYELGTRAWVYALTDALETTLTATESIRKGEMTRDLDALSDSMKRMAEARARYADGA